MQHAESGNGDRLDAPVIRVAAPDAAAPASDLDRLKDILLGDELGALDALDARVEKVEREQSELPARLPGAIESAEQDGAERMAHALAKPVAHALGTAVRENRQVIVDVLFPVIGPAIRKAIAEALRNLVTDVNGAIESSFTPRGLRWRFEAWRSGVPYAQIAIKDTLNYGIDHVFLIERGSGLVLDRESAPHLPDLDSDAIAGMLTAIGEFVRDSVGSGGGTLDSARVGEHLLWVVHGPRANLACFLHGVPPPRLHALLEQRLEALHAGFGADGRSVDDASRESLHPEVLMYEARAADRSAALSASPWPMRIVSLAALALLGWMIVRNERANAWVESVRARLASHHGFVLTGIERQGRDALIARGLFDPDAEPVATALGDDAPRVTLDTVGYVSTDDAIVARRARRLLAAPQSVTIAVDGGALALGGRAVAAWVDTARERAAWVPGVRRVDFSVASESDEAARARDELDTLAGSLPERRVAFVRETELAPDAAAVFEAIVGDALRAQSLAATAGVSIAWIATGTNDDPGSDATNARVRAERARWLVEALAARGIADVRTAADDDASDVSQRSAFLRFVLAEAQP